MGTTRRELMGRAALGAALVGLGARWAHAEGEGMEGAGAAPKPITAQGYRPTTTLDGKTLPYRMVDGVKVFHMVAGDVEHEFAPGLLGRCWGYNGIVHGPTIEAVEGDHVRIYVTNKLSAPTTVHWHGLFVPSGMDGVGGLSQRPIEPGETFRYEFTLRQHGTFMYHPHHDEMTQMALGLMGMIVVHPREPKGPLPDRDYVYMLGEWAMDPGVWRPDPNEMKDFNILTLNARAFPGTSPMVAQLGERVRIRIGNLSAMDHHPIHLHGYAFEVIETDGGQVPTSARWPETTVLVPTGSVRVVEFIADNPGDWAIHCHMTHHIMNQMGHGVPNTAGVDVTQFDERLMEHVPEMNEIMEAMMSGDDMDKPPPNGIPMIGGTGPRGYITMGGMFTTLRVRERLPESGDVGWYDAPAETQARPASADELRTDGVDPTSATGELPP
ncbi:MAG: copper oxidase [Dehalococcoidia bacterium]|nr:copper oxidase [Dehalococcoidia bacterium]